MATHEAVEKNTGLLVILIILVVSVAGLVEIVPLFFLKSTTEPVDGLEPYSALELEGRDVYIREGCYVCHSQMIRPFRSETERYGHYSVAGEFVYDHPFQWGSKRTGPDLARVGGRYSDAWHRVHLINPRDVVPESNMPGFPWLAERELDGRQTTEKMRAMNTLIAMSCPKCKTYTEEQIAGAEAAVTGMTELDAVVEYLQGLGTSISARR
ncbi:MAG: cytochrome-c oxidase, cbb3-type subunit II [Gammaproteobacteria bacterium]|nr:cytochrome-c oxidase, cbb3-type subunit II [Gammaproteobacteria bacterium]NIR97553.1 cytochrome-c oxidase, cbb3-type subunit II [Gammaproteobacteria bacterium]NIT63191.1 cytochrome-c oxidase, cbb3-type subunit II [Gammaproteobacteria bacterium]NIV20139.1 cytochrome-c oxidase, cbb3-type subunit II [Gammaproteobacteria bacterium]NIX10475.1 cytochrome-c oxidase, cbb3-type subunit II [Gammaproteobacteria bacterium]